MHLKFERIPAGDLTKKAEYFGVSDFARVHHSPRPDLAISKKWGPRSFFIPSRHEQSVEEIDNFVVRPDDVWIVGFPKTGTTWTQEMVWQICNDLDFEKGKSIQLYKRSPLFEKGTSFSFRSTTQSLAMIDALPSPRIIKSHLPAPLLPKGIWTVKPRIIYIARNIKDTAISFYHLYRNILGYRGTFNDYMEAFLGDAVIFTPLEGHITDYWNVKNESNVLFLTYEEMKKDLKEVLRKTSKFLGKTYSEDQIKALEDHLSFNKMASNKSVNFEGHLIELSTITRSDRDMEFKFMRKGKVGSYNEEMTPEMIEQFDTQIRKRHSEYKAAPELLDIFLGKA
ncbi:sulfotransferase 1B1-like [Lutzomyia longipalpis]|uniref:sulfotransferase 1B1-like n=1 Tax=Lutzomyia longipalpis TaxID=7200 RepID=UPI002483F476|nr:sulfotransferase 1B1-like [Lutzomyia longipalpis]